MDYSFFYENNIFFKRSIFEFYLDVIYFIDDVLKFFVIDVEENKIVICCYRNEFIYLYGFNYLCINF